MMAKILSLAGYLGYIVCMVALSIPVLGAMSGSPSVMNLPDFIKVTIFFVLPLALKILLWLVQISESPYTLSFCVSQVIAILLSVSCYLVCPMIVPVLLGTCTFVLPSAALWRHIRTKHLPYWIFMIIFWVTFVVTDWVARNYVDPSLISEFLYKSLSFLTHIATLLSLPCMVVMSCLVLLVAHGAIQNTRSWWPELIHTSIVGLTLLLLNMMWGSPFQKPSADSDTRAALVGLAGYLVYIVSSMVLSYNLFGALLLVVRTFVISLTFVLLDVFVKPSSVSDKIAALGTIATALLAFFFLVAMSFVVFMFLHTWVEMLLPSACLYHPARTFAAIVGLAFVAMKAMLDVMLIPAIDETSVFSGMKAALLSIADTINGGAFVGIRNLAVVLAVPLLSTKSRPGAAMYPLYTKAALIVALGLVLTMPPGPAFTLVSDDFVQETITSFVTSQFQSTDGGDIMQITDS